MSRPVNKTLGELNELLAFVLLYAPDHFLARHNTNLRQAFAEIRASLDNCAEEIGDDRKLAELKRLALESEAAYGRNEIVKGAHLLQDLKEALGR